MKILKYLLANLVSPATKLADDSETAIGAFNVMVNPTINIVDVKFDEELLAKYEWLQLMQQKHDIDMMLFSEKKPLESETQVEDTLFAVSHVSEEIKETKTKEEGEK